MINITFCQFLTLVWWIVNGHPTLIKLLAICIYWIPLSLMGWFCWLMIICLNRSSCQCSLTSHQQWNEDAGTIWVRINKSFFYYFCFCTSLSQILCIVIHSLFRGRNFVIKFEGSFKSGNSECFVLEHVKHDRPEVIIDCL